MLVDPTVTSKALLVTIGDRRVIECAARIAGVDLALEFLRPGDDPPDGSARPIFVDRADLDPTTIPVGVISEAGGRSALGNFKSAIEMATRGKVDAVAFSPFNKSAMRLAHPSYQDEGVFLAEMLGIDGTASEFNIIPDLWNARVTSHVPISGVAALITFDSVLRGLRLTDLMMRESGYEQPRIAVAGLNPHAGDNGNFGREEIDIITPCVEHTKAEGIAADGPFSPDTIFVRAKDGAFDAVLTMYHDQGQIAIKLLGFEQGVTLLGGLPFPVLTAAHGSAYDIAGKGVANPGAMREALLLAARMGARRQGAKAHAA